MIEITEEMYGVFEYAGDIPEGVARLLAIVERDYDVTPKPTMHLRVSGDWHVHCCGMEIGALPRGDDVTLDPHGVTCKGPS